MAPAAHCNSLLIIQLMSDNNHIYDTVSDNKHMYHTVSDNKHMYCEFPTFYAVRASTAL